MSRTIPEVPAPGAPTRCRPSYLNLSAADWDERVARALAELEDCRACPRDCGVNRLEGKWAACKTGRYAVVGSHFPHFGEEDCLRGWNGSGTIFFSHCNLRCQFCFHPDTPIPTDRGLVRIEELFEEGTEEGRDPRIRGLGGKIGVRTREGIEAPVTRAFRHHHVGDLIELKPYNCPPLLLTPGHRVFVTTRKDPSTVEKVPAARVRPEHRLLVPIRRPAGDRVVLEVDALLGTEKRTFRKSPPRRMAGAELVPLFHAGHAFTELAEMTGYHPAYLRKLRGEWKRGVFPEEAESGLASNDLVLEEGTVRFKTERRPGIPARIPLDEDTAWLLGLYCAEGHVTSHPKRRNSHQLVFSVGHAEEERSKRVEAFLRRIFGVTPKRVKRRTTWTVEVAKSSLALFFRTLCGKGARSKRVPPMLTRCTKEVLSSFLEGVLAGDGFEAESHRVVNTVSRRFAEGLFELGLHLGMLPSWHRSEPAPQTVIEGREVREPPRHYVKFPRMDPETGRRRSRFHPTNGVFHIPIHRTRRVPYEGPVYNLEVDHPDHSYLAPFVAVGNCQNYDISQAVRPQAAPGSTPDEIADMMLGLQRRGCHNINFVTPEHVVPQVVEAVAVAVRRGLRLPIVYNTSAYDCLPSLRLMDGIVDIYMPDLKFWSRERSKLYMKAEDYPDHAGPAVKEMARQVGPLVTDGDGLAKRGLIVRHLVMPGMLDETRTILAWVADELGPDTYVNLMDQYYPAGKVGEEHLPEINRKLAPEEWDEAHRISRELGLGNLDERRPHLLLRARLARPL